MSTRTELRRHILLRMGADAAQAGELLLYNENAFEFPDELALPLPDERFVAVWQEFSARCARDGSIAFLAQHLPQLRFPVVEGVSSTPDYLAATRKGVQTPFKCHLRAPERCRIVIHPTAAGHIPLIITEVREDFVYLVQSLTKRNEPVPIPASMGACMVAGYNNWYRVEMLRRQGWDMQRIIPQKDLYQDRFIILSDGPYSNVAAADLGLEEIEWRNASLVIRREHECAHYFTRRVFSSMRNNLLDEMIADYCGIVAACGAFRKDWFLAFLGLSDYPLYREGSRLENYRGDPPLSDGAFAVLQRLVYEAAGHLESFTHGPVPLMTLARYTMEEIAAGELVSEEKLCEK
jgi:hypothetical protein